MTFNRVTLEDIQPGAEFHYVFCVRGERPHTGTVVCNAAVIQDERGKHWADVSMPVDHPLYTFCYSHLGEKQGRHKFSMLDMNVEPNMPKVYNLHRWFLDKESADNFVREIATGHFSDPKDQEFYDSRK